MKHPEFYNVVINSADGDYGITHDEENPVKIIVHLPGKQWGEDEALVELTIAELVELVAKSKGL